MPIYEYQCEQCGVFEEMQRITDPPLSRCPKCRRKVKRLISNTSFQLKGSGWYVTDYARSGSGNGGKKDAADSSASSESKTEKSDAKSDSKSDAKAETKAASKTATTEKPAS
ncbi:MAG TPA: zinc ribbon domain-containing protein [Candidatus Binatia bacterium]|nr:zinc ribbon domain-containing protein [Candidatus Binatia bacterium]